MISSKKITVISIVLVAFALVFSIVLMLMPSVGVVGTVALSDLHSINFTEDDYYTNYSSASVAKIDLDTLTSNSKNVNIIGNEITILGGGTYVLSGELYGNIIVDSENNSLVRLILNNAHITSEDFSPLFINQADKVVISLIEGTENSLTDGKVYNEEKLTDSKPSSALYSKDSVTINGKGALNIAGNFKDGINVNDGLKIMEGNINITAVGDGINVNDYIAVNSASINVNAGIDAIKCQHDEQEYGFISLENCTLELVAGDDGISASSSVYINSVTANIENCTEGIEGSYITINSGSIKINATDDGLNALGTNSGFMRPVGMQKKNINEEDILLTINGGDILIEAGGDGIDANGAVRVNGGNIQLYGPENNGNSSFDFEYGFLIDGGSIIAAGSSGMATSPHSSSVQNSLVFYTGSFPADSTISVKDSDGNEIISGTSTKKFDWVCVSTPHITTGKTYSLYINGQSVSSLDATDTVTSSGGKNRW